MINKPNTASRRYRKTRRRRPEYPVIDRGTSVAVEREECGINIEYAPTKPAHARRVLAKKFIFTSELPAVPRLNPMEVAA